MRRKMFVLFTLIAAILLVTTACFSKSDVNKKDINAIVDKSVSDSLQEALKDPALRAELTASLQTQGVDTTESSYALAEQAARESSRQLIITISLLATEEEANTVLSEPVDPGSQGPDGFFELVYPLFAQLGLLHGDFVITASLFLKDFLNDTPVPTTVGADRVMVMVEATGDAALGDMANEVLYDGTLAGLAEGIFDPGSELLVFLRPSQRNITDAPDYNAPLGLSDLTSTDKLVFPRMLWPRFALVGIDQSHLSFKVEDPSVLQSADQELFRESFFITDPDPTAIAGAPVFTIRGDKAVLAGLLLGNAPMPATSLGVSANKILRVLARMQQEFGAKTGVGEPFGSGAEGVPGTGEILPAPLENAEREDHEQGPDPAEQNPSNVTPPQGGTGTADSP